MTPRSYCFRSQEINRSTLCMQSLSESVPWRLAKKVDLMDPDHLFTIKRSLVCDPSLDPMVR